MSVCCEAEAPLSEIDYQGLKNCLRQGWERKKGSSTCCKIPAAVLHTKWPDNLLSDDSADSVSCFFSSKLCSKSKFEQFVLLFNSVSLLTGFQAAEQGSVADPNINRAVVGHNEESYAETTGQVHRANTGNCTVLYFCWKASLGDLSGRYSVPSGPLTYHLSVHQGPLV